MLAIRSSRDPGSMLIRNMTASVIRVGVTAAVAFVLPLYLTSRLPSPVYGAWVLILQLGAYVNLLDLGIQTGVAKFVAEREATGDLLGAGRFASAGFVLSLCMAVMGILLTSLLAQQVPTLFHTMPRSLDSDVQWSVVLVGMSLCVSLGLSVFSTVFIGLQRYSIPVAITLINRILFCSSVCVTVHWHGGLRVMAACTAAVNTLAAVFQVVCWKTMASQVKIALSLVDRVALLRMFHYCMILAIWSVGMLFVSGLDVAIVGHFDFADTAFYSIAVMPVNFVLMLISAALGPMLPASSALSMKLSPVDMGKSLTRSTRYNAMLLMIVGLPLLVYGTPILRAWVGPQYAIRSIGYLRILVLANMLRNLCLPYSTMVVATGRQLSATLATASEGVVNLGSSVYLAAKYGAIGVAYGTVLGAAASVLLHFLVSMPATYPALSVRRLKLLVQGIVRPLAIAIPAVLLYGFLSVGASSAAGIATGLVWTISTLSLVWWVAVDASDRASASAWLFNLIKS